MGFPGGSVVKNLPANAEDVLKKINSEKTFSSPVRYDSCTLAFILYSLKNVKQELKIAKGRNG